MKLFLDASVLLAACGRPVGGSRAVCDLAAAQGWRLLAGAYVMREVETNLSRRFPPAAQEEWQCLRLLLEVVADVLTFDWPVVFPAAKDRPVLFTAAATADVLLTLDRADFGSLMGADFYGLPVMKPGDFLRRERVMGRLL
ncbi:MAG: PIN domain-containing protein [Chthoniobacterales bacterium]